MVVTKQRPKEKGGKFSWVDYLLEDEDIRPPGVFQLTVSSQRLRPNLEITNKESFLDRLSEKVNSLSWRPKKGSLYKEGFLNIDQNKRLGMFSCVYSRESALKIRQEENLRIVEQTYKAISSSHRVKIELAFSDNKDLSITFYGGERIFMAKARNVFIKNVRSSFPGTFSQIEGNFDSEEMRRIYNQFSDDVEEVGISPGKSHRLKLFINENRELVYEVHVNAFGYRIGMAPAVKELLEDEEIKINAIKGYLKYEEIKVKTVITSGGRVYFYFPGNSFDEESIYDAGRYLYGKLQLQKTKTIEQMIIDSFGPVIQEVASVENVS